MIYKEIWRSVLRGGLSYCQILWRYNKDIIRYFSYIWTDISKSCSVTYFLLFD